jgi:CTD nuclear envelope phosphatase 1
LNSGGISNTQTLNDEGLPIHEIRETLDGDTIGDAPAPSGNGAVDAAPEEDYFAPEAVARREALKRRLFHDDSEDDDEDDDDDGDDDDDDDEDEGMDVDSPSPEAAPAPQAAPPAPATPEPTLAPPLDTPAASPPAITRSPSNPPKSILKAPTRKKSVTFDPSTRLPPDSPPAHSPTGGSLRIGRLGFPVADTVSESSAGPKPVPILAPPTPGRKSTGTATFGGFKRGFLTGPGSTPPAVPAPSSAVVEGPKVVEVGGVDIEEKPKKQSLFAQRRAAPALPRLADAKPMAAMKTAIVETPSQPVHRALADRLPTPVAPRFPTDPANPVLVVDHDDDESDYGDLGDFSDDEEDEYALDEALLQREVALALHARQGWVRPVDEDEIDQEAEDGVLMGVPRVSTITGSETDPLRIVNPTADDLGQFLRVGRADDGELVFERPIVHDSESEGDDDGEGSQDRRERRARRRDVMARLLAGDYEDGPAGVHPAQRAAEWQASLPPSVGAAPAPVPAAAPPAPRRIETGPVVERSGPAPAAVPVPVPAPAPAEPAAPRKVSRFKASGQ